MTTLLEAEAFLWTFSLAGLTNRMYLVTAAFAVDGAIGSASAAPPEIRQKARMVTSSLFVVLFISRVSFREKGYMLIVT